MSRELELCCSCELPTGRAGRADDSLYAGDYGPYCEDCWGNVPDTLAGLLESETASKIAANNRIAELEAVAGHVITDNTAVIRALEKRVEELKAENQRIAELEQQLTALWESMGLAISERDEVIAELEQQLAALWEAARIVVDDVCLPGPGDYRYNEEDWEAMDALETVLQEVECE